MKFWLGLAAALLMAAGTQAQDGDVPHFSVGDQTFAYTLSDGFCLPVGSYVTMSELMAKADNANQTALTFYRCDDMAEGRKPTVWGSIKSPIFPGAATVDRLALIAEI